MVILLLTYILSEKSLQFHHDKKLSEYKFDRFTTISLTQFRFLNILEA